MGGVASGTAETTIDHGVAASRLKTKSELERDFHNQYALKENLGHGAFARVYAATRRRHGSEHFAVKVIDLRDAKSKCLDFDSHRTRLNKLRINEFVNEVAIMSLVRGHDNVCSLVESFIDGGLAYIVLARCDRPLREALDRCVTLNEETLRGFFLGMLRGVAVLHARSVVHRDVKHENFMCSGSEDTVKLCDFGLACTLGPQGELQNTDYRGIVGSAPFMAPEILRTETYGAKVDVWSFGVVAHVLLCGGFPYTPLKMTRALMKAAITQGSPMPRIFLEASEEHRSISWDARRFVIRLLSRSSMERPTSTEALRDEFFTSRSLSQVCLRPVFEAAKRCPAFRDQDAKQADTSDVDVRLRYLQYNHCKLSAAAASPPASEVSTDVESSSGESGEVPKAEDSAKACGARQTPASTWPWRSHSDPWTALASACLVRGR